MGVERATAGARNSRMSEAVPAAAGTGAAAAAAQKQDPRPADSQARGIGTTAETSRGRRCSQQKKPPWRIKLKGRSAAWLQRRGLICKAQRG